MGGGGGGMRACKEENVFSGYTPANVLDVTCLRATKTDVLLGTIMIT